MSVTMRVGLVAVIVALLMSGIAGSRSRVVAQEPREPVVAEASTDAELSMRGFVVPDGMDVSLLAAEPDVANPVAFTVTNDGRIIVCETFRQEKGVEDNRGHMDWLNQDLQLESVDERAVMFQRFRGADVGAWAVERDRLRMLRDSDQDGRYETATVFADQFHELLDGTGAGVLEHNGTVYYTNIPHLWALKDTDADGVANEVQSLHRGYGVRVAFRGHDLHGLTVGPEGRIYFSIGDRGFNVVTKEGSRLKRVDTGAVFRCDPDGSNLEVFAYGLRNPQELAFDDDGNLFTGDNNSDGGDKARWVYVVQDGDTGWRMYYQYLDDRGPWNREHIWYPYRADDETTAVQPANILPPIINLGDGPSGLTFYPGVGLSERYRNHFFMADFRGTPGNSGIRSFAVEPNGATFTLTDSHQFIWSVLATDVDFAPDGSVVVSDWVNGWSGEGKGRLYRFAATADSQRAAGEQSRRRLAESWSDATPAELSEWLGHADRRIRQKAQHEMVRRGAVAELLAIINRDARPVAVRQAMFGAWQSALSDRDTATNVTDGLSQFIAKSDSSPASEPRTLAIRIVTDLVDRHGLGLFASAEARSELARDLVSASELAELRLAGFAAAALGRLGTPADASALLALLDRNENADPVVRHQAVMGLVKLTERHPGLLDSLATHPAAPGRLGVLLAMRRAGDANVASFLSDADGQLVAEAARAINDDQLETAQPKLAALMTTPGLDDATLRRAMNAGYRLGAASHAGLVAQVAADARTPKDVRLVAATLLRSWNTPQPTDTVTGQWRPLPKREVMGLDAAVKPSLAGMLSGDAELREAATELAADLGINDVVPELRSLLSDADSTDAVRVAAFRGLMKLATDKADVLEAALADEHEAVRLAAVEIATMQAPQHAVPRLRELLESPSLKAQQTALRLIGPIRTAEAEATLLSCFERLESGAFAAGATLDLITAAELRGTSKLKDAVAAYRERQSASGKLLDAWSECVDGGNPDVGREIYFGRGSASCRRCHKVAGSGSDVGPDLTTIGKDKDRQYLLEAIVDPNAKIAKGFETVVIATVDGLVHSGIIRSEDDSVVRLVTPTGTIVTVAKEDIDDRASGLSGMPQDLTKNLTRSDVRDLVAFLATLKEAPAESHGH